MHARVLVGGNHVPNHLPHDLGKLLLDAVRPSPELEAIRDDALRVLLVEHGKEGDGFHILAVAGCMATIFKKLIPVAVPRNLPLPHQLVQFAHHNSHGNYQAGLALRVKLSCGIRRQFARVPTRRQNSHLPGSVVLFFPRLGPELFEGNLDDILLLPAVSNRRIPIKEVDLAIRVLLKCQDGVSRSLSVTIAIAQGTLNPSSSAYGCLQGKHVPLLFCHHLHSVWFHKGP